MKRLFSYIIVGILCLGIGVGASTILNAKDIKYSNSNTSATNVSDALDEIIDKYNDLTLNLRTASYTANGTSSSNYMLFNGTILDDYKYFIVLSSNCNENVSSSKVYAQSSSDDSYPEFEINKVYKSSDYKNIWTVIISKNTTDEAYCDTPIKFYN